MKQFLYFLHRVKLAGFGADESSEGHGPFYANWCIANVTAYKSSLWPCWSSNRGKCVVQAYGIKSHSFKGVFKFFIASVLYKY